MSVLLTIFAVIGVVVTGLGIMGYLDDRKNNQKEVKATPEQVEKVNEWRDRCADMMHLDSLPMHNPLKNAFGMLDYVPVADRSGLQDELHQLVRASRLRAMEDAVESVRHSIEAVKADLAKGDRA